jgi:hypothetical protein
MLNLEKMNFSIEQIIEKISTDKLDSIYIKKPKGTVIIYLWYEDKTKWLINVANGKKNGKIEQSTFIIKKDLVNFFNFYHGNGYEFYKNNKNS